MPTNTKKLVLKRETIRSLASTPTLAKPAAGVDTVMETGEDTCINPTCGSRVF